LRRRHPLRARLDAARRAPLGASALRGSAARDRRGLSRARADPRADGRSVVGGPGLHLGGGARADRRGGALPRSLAPAPRPHAAGRLQGGFGGAHAASFGAWQHDNTSAPKTILANHGYYFGWGWAGRM